MRVAYRHVRPVSVVYVRAAGDYLTAATEAWGKLDDWLARHDLRCRMKRGFGVFHDNPQNTENASLRYDACADVGIGIDAAAAADISRQTLPGGTYAVHTHIGGYDRIGELMSELHREWVPKQGLVLDNDRPFVAIHLNDPRLTREVHRRTELCVPVQPLAAVATCEGHAPDKVEPAPAA